MLNIANPPTVYAAVGPTVALKYKSLDADTKRIMKAVTKLLPEQALTRIDPTPEQLAATYPPGYSPGNPHYHGAMEARET